MMKWFTIITVQIFCVSNTLFCQTIQFKGQLLQNNVPIKNYTVSIDGKAATTDDGGIFYTPLSAGTTHVTIVASDQQYVIVYPAGGLALVPKDISAITPVIVAAFKQNDYLKTYLTVSRQIQDSVGKSQLQVKQLRLQLDSMVALLRRLSYTDNDLRNAKEIQEGKERNLYDITTDLNDYSRNAQNLLSAFKYVSDYAFTNSNALQQLADAVSRYNDTYNRLDGKKDFYQKTINDYWGKSAADSFKTVIIFTLDTVHTQNIYPLRDLLQQIRDYFTAGNKSNALKISIQKKISDIIINDQQLIDVLKTKTSQFTQSLIT